MSQRTHLSQLLRRYRLAAGLSQEALAQQADLSARAISDLERGLHRVPHGATLDLLANALALSPQQRALLLLAARPELTSTTVDADAPTEVGAQTQPVFNPAPQGLPVPPTRMIGREREYTQAYCYLSSDTTRLLTITGPSGVGKTRLVLQLAQALVSHFRDGVIFIDLAAVRDPALVPSAVAQALQVRERSDASLAEQIRDMLRDRQQLLVLDNFEQVTDAAPFMADVLTWCPQITLLVTSRAPLHLRAEQLLQLAPLALEDAIVLFRERLHAIRQDITVAVSDAAAVCERVDCLPLAIELVASHISVRSPAEILDHLSRSLALSIAGARDLPARQRTMEAAIGWSYDLLTADQQFCFRALGVFFGGMSLPAIHAVAGGDSATSQDETLSMLAALVESGLVQTQISASGKVRFSLLELVREYAYNRLCNANEEDDCHRRHAAYFAGLSERLMALMTPPNAAAPEPAQDIPNIRAALEWARAHREATLGLRLTGYARLLSMRGMMTEAEYWLATMLALDAEVRAAGESAAPLRLRVGRLYGYARMLLNHGHIQQAEAVAQEALALAQHIDEQDALSEVYATIGLIAQAQGDTEQAARAFTESVAHATAEAARETRYRAHFYLAEIARNQGDFIRAHALLERALQGAKAAQNDWDCTIMTTMLAHLERQQGNRKAARSHYLEGLKRFHVFGASAFFAWCLEGYCALLGMEGKYLQAVRLSASAAALRQHAHAPLPESEREGFDHTVASACEALGASAFDTEWALGSSFTEAMALTEAESTAC